MNPHTQNGSDRGCAQGDMPQVEHQDRTASPPRNGDGLDHSLTLLGLLDVLSCLLTGEAEIECLAQTDLDRQHLRALVNLRQSLGRPTSVFWRETRVFYNRIVDSYSKKPGPG